MSGPMGCHDAVQRLWGYLDRDLEADEQRALEEHLAFCLRCCGELAFARELRGVLRTRTSVELPGDVRTRLESLIDDLGEDGVDAGRRP